MTSITLQDITEAGKSNRKGGLNSPKLAAKQSAQYLLKILESKTRSLSTEEIKHASEFLIFAMHDEEGDGSSTFKPLDGPDRASILWLESRLLSFYDRLEQKRVLNEAVCLGNTLQKSIHRKNKIQILWEEELNVLNLSFGILPDPEPTKNESEILRLEKKKASLKRSYERKKVQIAVALKTADTAGLPTLQTSYLNETLCGDSAKPRINWSSIPEILQPSYKRDAETRREHKLWQLESIAHVLASFPVSPPLHIVDFGSGSGNSALVFAYLYPMHRFTLLDELPVCIDLIHKRCEEAGITNVDTFHGRVVDYPNQFDLGLAIHLCGEVSKLLLRWGLRLTDLLDVALHSLTI